MDYKCQDKVMEQTKDIVGPQVEPLTIALGIREGFLEKVMPELSAEG